MVWGWFKLGEEWWKMDVGNGEVGVGWVDGEGSRKIMFWSKRKNGEQI